MARYSPGDWYAVVAGSSLALLPGRVPLATVEQIWRDLHERKGLAAVLDGLGGAFGTSLGNLPEFAVVVVSDDRADASVTVRGLIEARAHAVGAPDQVVVSGAGVTTWSERVISSVASVELVTPGSHREVSRPIVDGVVSVTRVLLPVREDEPAVTTSPPTLVPDDADASADPGRPPNGETLHEVSIGVQSMLGNTLMSPVEEAAVRHTDASGDDDHLKAGVARSDSGVGSEAWRRSQGLPVPASGDHDNLTLPAEQVLELQAGSGSDGRSTEVAGTNARVAMLVANGIAPVPLDRNIIVGRKPRLSRVQGGHIPRLVIVPSPGGEVSGSHLELRVEDSDVLAVDLNSTNGSRLLRVGREPIRLRPGEEVLLVSGDRLDLGDGVVLGFEGLL